MEVRRRVLEGGMKPEGLTCDPFYLTSDLCLLLSCMSLVHIKSALLTSGPILVPAAHPSGSGNPLPPPSLTSSWSPRPQERLGRPGGVREGGGVLRLHAQVTDPIIHFAGFGRALSAPCSFKRAGQSAGRSGRPAPAPN
ncbi:hypothetical protein JZ751_021593 [Albula glossodonta]|uniref:Uncharacterized protein n=1 Tax=Albula glossodonta TaxID=121402 RepID=A0A8T2NMM4_9TELE|nr:hypothetical protein JZ751_021593 [Albula glossodonta]